ncbi:MAG: adenine phosphoribosyltransferase [Acidobacteria bacterium]|nr:adenine phosphoribosyltransferase [Acidobacteriota bacterium]
MEEFKRIIREVPDFPKPGIVFYDLTTLFKDASAFRSAVDSLAAHYHDRAIDVIVGIESRGFIIGSCLAYQLGAGFVPVRKLGKLPAETVRQTYSLEYGSDSVEVHKDAIQPGQRVLICDDLIATGGTAAAVGELVKKLRGDLVGFSFLVELEFLNGRRKLDSCEVFSLIRYP